MAHKAPLLALINQGKCLAVTHRAVLSRGSSLIVAFSFIAGPILSSPELSGAQSADALLIYWWFFDSGQMDSESWRSFGLALVDIMMIIMLMILFVS